jgi:exodeoxyribonuclease V beta subunit
VADKNFLQQIELDQHQQRALAEQNRLWYVALTRASHRVYAVFEPEKGDKNKFSGLAFWKNQGDHFQHPYSADAALILERPQALQMQQTNNKLHCWPKLCRHNVFMHAEKPVLVIWHSI